MAVKDIIKDMQLVEHYNPEMTIYSDGHTQSIPNFKLNGNGRMTLEYKKEISDEDIETISFDYGKVNLTRILGTNVYKKRLNRNDVKAFFDRVISSPSETNMYIITEFDDSDSCFYLMRDEALGFLRQYCHLYEPRMGIIPES